MSKGFGDGAIEPRNLTLVCSGPGTSTAMSRLRSSDSSLLSLSVSSIRITRRDDEFEYRLRQKSKIRVETGWREGLANIVRETCTARGRSGHNHVFVVRASIYRRLRAIEDRAKACDASVRDAKVRRARIAHASSVHS